MKQNCVRPTVISLLATLALACRDPAAPETHASDVVGRYAATSFTTTAGGVTTDQLSQGSSLSLVLNSDGTSDGRLVVADAGDGSLDASMAGTWRLASGVVTLTQSADTFVRDMEWTPDAGRLTADRTFGATRVRVELRKQ